MADRSPARRTLPPTLGALLRLGEERFKAAHLYHGHGLPGPYDEAACLALHVLGFKPDQLEAHRNLRPMARKAAEILALYDRRIKERKPAAYLTHEAWLGELRFYVDERVIVPRSYIAELLRENLAPWIMSPRRVRSALDLCTGSGCLAILLARAFTRARIDAADLAPAALQVARRNVARYRLQRRIQLVRSDLFTALAGHRYDLIVSNPPYVAAAAMRRLPAEYRHEPRMALAGGSDGLAFARGILRQAAAHLNPGGMLVVEVGHHRARLERAFPRLPFVWPHTSGGEDCVFIIGRDELSPPGSASDPIRAKAR